MTQKINASCYKFNKGHVLFTDGNPIKGKSIFLIKKGSVKLKYRLKNSKSLDITIPEGGIFGVFEVLTGMDYRITQAEIIEETNICMWEKEDFLMKISMNPDFGLKSVVFLASFLRTLNKKIQEIG